MKSINLFLIVIVLSVSLVVGQPNGRVAIGTPFLGYTSVSQTLSATYFQYVSVYNSYGTGEGGIIGVPGEGYVVNSDPDFGGIQWTLPNGTYFYINYGGFILGCWYSFAGTLENETNAVNNAIKIGEDGIYDVYLGYIDTYGACGLGGVEEFLVNSYDGSLGSVSFAFFSPVPKGDEFIIPTTVSGGYQVQNVTIGGAVLPPLPEICWSLDVNDPASNYCFFWHFGLPCTGFNNFECADLPGPYIPQ